MHQVAMVTLKHCTYMTPLKVKVFEQADRFG